MKKTALIVLLTVFITIAFAENSCPKCKFSNNDEDRYCIECGFVIREINQQEKEEFEDLNRKNIKVENSSAPAVKVKRLNVDLHSEFVAHSADGVLVRITAKNRSTMPLKNLTVKVTVAYASTRANLDWKGEGVFSLIETFDPSFNPKDTLIREFKIFGRGTFRSENPNDCRINASVLNYSFVEDDRP